MKPTLVCLVGLPRSGKSSLARSWPHPIVNPDSIRLSLHGQRFYAPAEPWVWATAKLMVRSLFGSGHTTVVLDATNVTRSRRREWLSDEWDTRFWCVPTPASVCIERAVADGLLDLVPVIQQMDRQFEPLAATELRCLEDSA